MKLEDQVCSLELAKKLKELGVPQNSYFSWLVASDGERLMTNPVNNTYKYFEQCSAYLASELGEMLLPLIPVQIEGVWQAPSPKDQTVQKLGKVKEVTEADARAKMLIYLLENNLLSVN